MFQALSIDPNDARAQRCLKLLEQLEATRRAPK